MQQVSNLIEKDKQMRELMKFKEMEKSDLERMTLNKTDVADDSRMKKTGMRT